MNRYFYLTLALVALQLPMVVAAVETRCMPSGHTRLWAQRAAGLDLAQALVAKMGIPRVTKIGVIDTGFDLKQLARVSSGLTIVPLNQEAKKDVNDKVGHGTIVVGLIKGLNGLGGSTASPVSVYATGLGTMGEGVVANAALKACREGASILSISIGSTSVIADYVSLPQSVQFGEKVTKELKERGCLIVHSAGNEAAGKRFAGQDFEFEIGASGPLGKVAAFSSEGEFIMPGERVTSLISSAAKLAPGTIRCNQEPEALSSGTSFSTPLFAAHLALLRDVLLTSPIFVKYTSTQQIETIRQITNKSILGGMVNSYVSVRLAFEWLKNPAAGVVTAKNNMTSNCRASSSNTRSYALLCEDTESRLRLAKSEEQGGNLEGAAFWYNTIGNPAGSFPVAGLNKSNLSSASHLSAVARWVNYYNFRASTDLDAKKVLAQATTSALSNFEVINPQLRSPDFAREFRELGLFAIGAEPNSQLLERMILGLRTDPVSQSNLVVFLLKGNDKKLIHDDWIVRLLEIFTAQKRSETDLRSALTLLKYTRIDFEKRLYYINRLLNASDRPKSIYDDLNLVGLDNSASAVEVSHWLRTLDALLNSPNCAVDCASAVAIGLFGGIDSVGKADRTELEKILTKLEPMLPAGSNFKALPNFVRSQLPATK